jgi:hypothetical protein
MLYHNLVPSVSIITSTIFFRYRIKLLSLFEILTCHLLDLSFYILFILSPSAKRTRLATIVVKELHL